MRGLLDTDFDFVYEQLNRLDEAIFSDTINNQPYKFKNVQPLQASSQLSQCNGIQLVLSDSGKDYILKKYTDSGRESESLATFLNVQKTLTHLYNIKATKMQLVDPKQEEAPLIDILTDDSSAGDSLRTRLASIVSPELLFKAKEELTNTNSLSSDTCETLRSCLPFYILPNKEYPKPTSKRDIIFSQAVPSNTILIFDCPICGRSYEWPARTCPFLKGGLTGLKSSNNRTRTHLTDFAAEVMLKTQEAPRITARDLTRCPQCWREFLREQAKLAGIDENEWQPADKQQSIADTPDLMARIAKSIDGIQLFDERNQVTASGYKKLQVDNLNRCGQSYPNNRFKTSKGTNYSGHFNLAEIGATTKNIFLWWYCRNPECEQCQSETPYLAVPGAVLDSPAYDCPACTSGLSEKQLRIDINNNIVKWLSLAFEKATRTTTYDTSHNYKIKRTDKFHFNPVDIGLDISFDGQAAPIKIAIEYDGYHHAYKETHDRDVRKSLGLIAAGVNVIRVIPVSDMRNEAGEQLTEDQIKSMWQQVASSAVDSGFKLIFIDDGYVNPLVYKHKENVLNTIKDTIINFVEQGMSKNEIAANHSNDIKDIQKDEITNEEQTDIN